MSPVDVFPLLGSVQSFRIPSVIRDSWMDDWRGMRPVKTAPLISKGSLLAQVETMDGKWPTQVNWSLKWWRSVFQYSSDAELD